MYQYICIHLLTVHNFFPSEIPQIIKFNYKVQLSTDHRPIATVKEKSLIVKPLHPSHTTHITQVLQALSGSGLSCKHHPVSLSREQKTKRPAPWYSEWNHYLQCYYPCVSAVPLLVSSLLMCMEKQQRMAQVLRLLYPHGRTRYCGILASAWHSPSCCGHVGSKQSDRSSFSNK